MPSASSPVLTSLIPPAAQRDPCLLAALAQWCRLDLADALLIGAFGSLSAMHCSLAVGYVLPLMEVPGQSSTVVIVPSSLQALWPHNPWCSLALQPLTVLTDTERGALPCSAPVAEGLTSWCSDSKKGLHLWLPQEGKPSAASFAPWVMPGPSLINGHECRVNAAISPSIYFNLVSILNARVEGTRLFVNWRTLSSVREVGSGKVAVYQVPKLADCGLSQVCLSPGMLVPRCDVLQVCLPAGLMSPGVTW